MRSAGWSLSVLAMLTAGGAAVQATADPPKIKRVAVSTNSEAPGYEGYRALDGDRRTMWHTDWTATQPTHPHEITVDLGEVLPVEGIVYVPRLGGGNGTIARYELLVTCDRAHFGRPLAEGTFSPGDAPSEIRFEKPVLGRFVRLRALSEARGAPWASVAELEILVPGYEFRAASGFDLVRDDGTPLDEIERQFVLLENDLHRRGHFARVAAETFHPQALVWETDRDPVDIALRRTAALLDDIAAMPDAGDLSALRQALDRLAAEAEAVEAGDRDARLALYRRIAAVRREIAFANPLLDFDRLLFITRHRSRFNHMCDQYYGVNAEPGGGLYVLEGAFTSHPAARNLLAEAVVERGRLAGERLTGGSFLSPALSFDAQQIAFAYVECTGDTAHRFHTDPARGHWHEGRAYHIFRVQADGTGLVQLTDGTWNDFDPCWLPNGRIAFISERRGGYLRCGRVCPTYTLFDMNAEGRNLRCLSYHETNEWNPSVTHDGRIIYTRWDYVDRHGCTAHHPWITTLDGRDSRAVHGNFAPRSLRADMELSVRAIPGSHKFVATAAPHHGQAFGSLILIDPRVPDDDAMAPVKRLTPEVGFPETQGGAQVYGTPWPLSEKYHLCVYDPAFQPKMGGQGGAYLRGDYAIYLVDAFGNRERIYHDPEIACLSPIPFRPRPLPPHAPDIAVPYRDEQPFVAPPEEGQSPPAEATVAVIDVYESLKPWPEGTRITALRVVQILPMTVPSGSPPHEIGLRLPEASDSVMPARWVLGTVPVEADGSAYFKVPAHKEMFFQALDERGLAVQSMRSATYLQAGEMLACRGCHEPKETAPALPAAPPLALMRPPSELRPAPEGARPFSYPQLVQPVLDRHCVSCHGAKDPEGGVRLTAEPIERNWFASYNQLAPKYGYTTYRDGYRTTPGAFGAQASKLLELLDAGHHDVKLSDEEFERITLWLDMVSVFYGVYEREGGQAQLRGETVRPTLE